MKRQLSVFIGFLGCSLIILTPMARSQSPKQHILQQERPLFLDLLDSDPENAQAQVYNFAYRLFQIKPPRKFMAWVWAGAGEDMRDFINRLFVHCCDNGFRVLRTYRVIPGRMFSVWLLSVANNLMIDDLRRHSTQFVPIDAVVHREGNPGSNPQNKIEYREMLSIFKECLRQLSPRERDLIESRIQAGPPRNIIANGKHPDTHKERKKLADDTRYALKKLLAVVQKQNADLYQYLVEKHG